ncbi:MAG: DUF2259 domain-containing protein [Pyrinomonadaceae bacterium]
MIKALRLTLTLLVLFFVSVSTALAGDYSTLNFIGFSKDGRYLAFEEYGTQDGSGFPYSSYFFIDTAKNAYAAPQVKARIESESASEASARSKAALLAAKNLKQFGIVQGNTGQHVVSHIINDLTLDETETIVRFAEEIGSAYQKGVYELTVKPLPVKNKACEPYELDTFMLHLTLANKDDETTKVLQKDTVLPESRGCVMSYRIQDVYLYKGTIAVFLNVFTPGFEGPDMRFITVTGSLK